MASEVFTFIGIDPGASGAVAIQHTGLMHTMKLTGTEADVSEFIDRWARLGDCFAFLESVHSMPKQGVSSSFKFGASFGFLKGLLVGLKVPFELVTPQRWQKAMGCMSGGNKNVTKQACQRLFPFEKVSHATADAMLISEFCRRELAIRSHKESA